jgi:hypothetical protein
MPDALRFVPGQFWQGQDEEISYVVNVGNWATAPTGASCTVWEGASNRSTSNLQNSTCAPTISGSLITTPCIVALRVGVDYRIEVMFQQGGEIYEGYFMVTGQT